MEKHIAGILVQLWRANGTTHLCNVWLAKLFDFAASGSLVAQNSLGLIYAVPAGPLGSSPLCGEEAAYPVAARPCQPPQTLPDGSPNSKALFLQSGCETGFNAGHLGATGVCDGPAVSIAQGRNHFRGPRYFNTDFAITKRTKISHWQNSELGIGFQFFNFFNHPNFGFPDILLADSTFGEIFNLEQPPTSVLGAGLGDVAPRMIQLKIQLQF